MRRKSRSTLSNKGQCLTHRYYADLVCFGQVIVELKALSRLSGNEEAQVLNYLKATDFKVGVLINFGRPGKLEWKRFAKHPGQFIKDIW